RRRHQPSRPPLAKIRPGIWDSRNLAGTRRFEPTGPCLPIEFCRVSRNEYLTLVIDEIVGVPRITYSATSDFSDLDDARAATRPVPMGSPANTKMGISRVACFAAKAHGMKMAAMTPTLRRTNSCANCGSRSAFASRMKRRAFISLLGGAAALSLLRPLAA